MLIPPNQTRSPSSPMCPNSMTYFPNLLLVIHCLMWRPKNACNSSEISPVHYISGSRNRSSLCKYVLYLHLVVKMGRDNQKFGGFLGVEFWTRAFLIFFLAMELLKIIKIGKNLGMKRTLVHIAFNPFLGWVSGNRKPKFLVPDRPITSFTDIYCFTYRRTNLGISLK